MMRLREAKTVTKSPLELYEERLRKHISAVIEFGEKIGVPGDQLYKHDSSKWSEAEFRPYALRLCSSLPEEETAAEFAIAWLHHIHHNPHH